MKLQEPKLRTLDEEITRCLETAEKYEIASKGQDISDLTRKGCQEVATEQRQLAEWLTELKEARKLLTPTRYKVEHEEWDMHGEHYIGDYALCPNCNKCFTNIYNGKATPVVTFCPDCGQKIDWS